MLDGMSVDLIMVKVPFENLHLRGVDRQSRTGLTFTMYIVWLLLRVWSVLIK